VARCSDPQSRLDLHNININFAAASRGRCGFTHLDSGRVCQLPHRHRGPCDLRPRDPCSSNLIQSQPPQHAGNRSAPGPLPFRQRRNQR
jgi:hypothetical protein